ncbi:LacI family DNA-binding transcriptional regulator [Pseudonocardia sp. GCM10023141]|uniref:LacI family DNA-binding transcriptional regulator n=1 Tax=Pseudonocardia sp. GCM10023141 TaxID=3252653 RepID=UPI00360FC10B
MTDPTPPDAAPTIRTVAARAGVSKSLVSLVLRGSPQVSPQRRQAVLDAMDELRYRPDAAARSLAERRSRTVGVVIDDLTNPWFVDVLAGLRPPLRAGGLRALLADGRTEPDAVDALSDLRVDGLVLVGSLGETAVSQLRRLGTSLPAVVAGSREPLLPHAPVVVGDNERGAHLATAHLLDLGHRRIAHVIGEGEVGRLRHRGFATALAAAGLEPAAVVAGDWTEQTGYRVGTHLLRLTPRPTAVLAANDLSAIGVMAAAEERGLRVPEDLSVVGYDDTVFARLRRIALTTVDNAGAAVGRAAGELLAAWLTSTTIVEPTGTTLLEPNLVVRGSSGPAPVDAS